MAYLVLLAIYHGALEATLAFLGEPLLNAVLRLLVSFSQWLWMLAVLGLGHTYINRPGPGLRYLNHAILPWCSMYQTLIVLLVFWLAPLALNQTVEAALLLVGTVAECALGCDMVRRSRAERLLFGLKQ